MCNKLKIVRCMKKLVSVLIIFLALIGCSDDVTIENYRYPYWSHNDSLETVEDIG